VSQYNIPQLAEAIECIQDHADEENEVTRTSVDTALRDNDLFESADAITLMDDDTFDALIEKVIAGEGLD
jgi:hypothetical protein